MLSWLERKQRQKDERQKDGLWLRPLGIIKEMLTVKQREAVNIFLPSIFLSLLS